jgi:hypothetical protein
MFLSLSASSSCLSSSSPSSSSFSSSTTTNTPAQMRRQRAAQVALCDCVPLFEGGVCCRHLLHCGQVKLCGVSLDLGQLRYLFVFVCVRASGELGERRGRGR